jgi:uncharacterized membrane protein YagU involved in acid resistance
VGKKVTTLYRGATYELRWGPACYGIWPAGEPQSPPFERWPETPEGWYGAWSRFAGIEVPGTIVQVRQGAVPVVMARTRQLVAAALLAIGVGCGIAGLFPSYLGGASLASMPDELVPHAIYLAVWSASAVLILLGGARLRVGALLGLGTSIVTFGFFFADAGTAITAGGAHFAAGLVLGLAGWLACAAGSAMAFQPRSADAPGRPDGYEMGAVLALVLAALGAAVAFAPAWDSFTLRAADGVTQSLTLGNAFANPGLVIAGDVAVMVALVAVVVAAALWRPVRLGAALLAGAIIPMAAEAISAVVELGEPVSPAQFGILPAAAAQAGLTISSGVTPAFWIYCGFLVVMVVMCARMLIPPRRGAPDATLPPATLGATAHAASTSSPQP